MNTRTTLNTLLLATLLLSPVAFAAGAQVNQATFTDNGVVCGPVAAGQTSTAVQGTAAVSRAILQRIDMETRQALLASLRDSGFLTAVVQAAAPALSTTLQSSLTSR